MLKCCTVVEHVQVWRGYIQRKKTKIERVKELIALGMVSCFSIKTINKY